MSLCVSASLSRYISLESFPSASGLSGDPDIYVALDHFPTLIDHNYSDTSCEPCGEQSVLRIPMNELSVGSLIIGLYGFCCDPTELMLTASNVEPINSDPAVFDWRLAYIIFSYLFGICMGLGVVFGCVVYAKRQRERGNPPQFIALEDRGDIPISPAVRRTPIPPPPPPPGRP